MMQRTKAMLQGHDEGNSTENRMASASSDVSGHISTISQCGFLPIKSEIVVWIGLR
jgi:hypothetical protein